jgi:hypothetical protein
LNSVGRAKRRSLRRAEQPRWAVLSRVTIGDERSEHALDRTARRGYWLRWPLRLRERDSTRLSIDFLD